MASNFEVATGPINFANAQSTEFDSFIQQDQGSDAYAFSPVHQQSWTVAQPAYPAPTPHSPWQHTQHQEVFSPPVRQEAPESPFPTPIHYNQQPAYDYTSPSPKAHTQYVHTDVTNSQGSPYSTQAMTQWQQQETTPTHAPYHHNINTALGGGFEQQQTAPAENYQQYSNVQDASQQHQSQQYDESPSNWFEQQQSPPQQAPTAAAAAAGMPLVEQQPQLETSSSQATAAVEQHFNAPFGSTIIPNRTDINTAATDDDASGFFDGIPDVGDIGGVTSADLERFNDDNESSLEAPSPFAPYKNTSFNDPLAPPQESESEVAEPEPFQPYRETSFSVTAGGQVQTSQGGTQPQKHSGVAGYNFTNNSVVPAAVAYAPRPPLSQGLRSGTSSMCSSPRGKTNAAIEAGKRRLEEYKRKKTLAAYAKSTPPTSNTTSPTAVQPIQPSLVASLEAQLAAAVQRAEAAEASASNLNRDLNSVLRQLETVDSERAELQREKAALVGETVALRASVTATADASNTVAAVEHELEKVSKEAELAFERAAEFEALLTKEREEYAQHIATLEQQHNQAQQFAAGADTEVINNLHNEIQQLRLQVDTAQQAAETEREAREEMEQSLNSAYQDIESLRETLGEGEGERVALVQQLQEAQQRVEQLEKDMLAYQQQQQEYYYSNEYQQQQQPQGQQNEEALYAAQQAQQYAEAELNQLKTQVEAAQKEMAELQNKCSSLQTELDIANSYLNNDGKKNRQDDPLALRMRLDKAEATIENERRTVQSLERQVREGRAAAEEGRAATAAALELRVKLDAAEREAGALRTRLQDVLSRGGHHPHREGGGLQEDEMRAAVRAAEERASVAEAAAHDLRAQCDSAAHAMGKLMDENSELAARLNRLSDETVRLQSALLATRPSSGAEELPTPNSSGGYNGEYRQQQYHFQHMPTVMETPQTTRLPVPIDLEGKGGENVRPMSPFSGGQGAELYPQTSMVSVADSDMTSASRSERRRGNGQKRKGYSFWSWIAGADIADSVVEEDE